MTLFAAYSDSIAAGTRITLADFDNVFVKAGVMLARSDFGDAVIRATGVNNTYDIQGMVLGNGNGIFAGDNGALDYYQRITVASTGVIKSYKAAGIEMNAYAGTVTNHGHIEGEDAGILMNGMTTSSASTIENTGEIVSANDGIGRNANALETLNIHNTGLIRGIGNAVLGGDGSEVIVNEGRMEGTITLNAGDDIYDGRLGTVTGGISGGAGKDTMLGGAGDEFLDGGGDDDTIEGGGGNDAIQGGAGADKMRGGAGDDIYGVDNVGDIVTEKAGEGTDTVYAEISFSLTANGVDRLEGGTATTPMSSTMPATSWWSSWARARTR